MYGGDGGLRECRCELIRWTNVDFPAPAMPMVIMTMGFFFSCDDWGASMLVPDCSNVQ